MKIDLFFLLISATLKSYWCFYLRKICCHRICNPLCCLALCAGDKRGRRKAMTGASNIGGFYLFCLSFFPWITKVFGLMNVVLHCAPCSREWRDVGRRFVKLAVAMLKWPFITTFYFCGIIWRVRSLNGCWGYLIYSGYFYHPGFSERNQRRWWFFWFHRFLFIILTSCGPICCR